MDERYVAHTSVASVFIPADALAGHVDPALVQLDPADAVPRVAAPAVKAVAAPPLPPPARGGPPVSEVLATEEVNGVSTGISKHKNVSSGTSAEETGDEGREPRTNGAVSSAADETDAGHASAGAGASPRSDASGDDGATERGAPLVGGPGAEARGVPLPAAASTSTAEAGDAAAASSRPAELPPKAPVAAGGAGGLGGAGHKESVVSEGGDETPLSQLLQEDSEKQRERRSQDLKDLGNAAFKAKRYGRAIELYTEAIGALPTAVLFANRAAAHLKCESFGLAERDATASISLDPLYIKAYHRRGTARLALHKFGLAAEDLATVLRHRPDDVDIIAKITECREASSHFASERELSVAARVADSIETIVVPETYKGPHLGTSIDVEFVRDMMEHFKHQGRLHKKYALRLLLLTKAILKDLPSLVHVQTPEKGHLRVCGDTHGQFYDLLNIFALGGEPSPDTPYVFNGDFVDRGSFSVETVLTLFAWKVLYPNSVHLSRGNHETKVMNLTYGFDGEVMAKYDRTVMDLFTEVFNWLPIAHVVDHKVFIVHGGLFSDPGVTLDQIAAVERNGQPPDSGIMSDALWSDPQPFSGRGASKRGVGIAFGPDVTREFLETNDLKLLIRSHEVKAEGYLVEHGGMCITVFSAPNYCDQMGNKGAFVKLDRATLTPEFVTFGAVPHPHIRPMAYASDFFTSLFMC